MTTTETVGETVGPARGRVGNILVAGTLTLVSLAAGASALVLAEFGAPVWIFVVLLTLLVTAGLPSLVAVLMLALLWPGPSFLMFTVASVVLAFLFHLGAVVGIHRVIGQRRRRTAV